MKKHIALFLVCTLLFAACSDSDTGIADTSAETDHVHTPSDTWERDADNHWQVCECGENVNAASHVFDDADRCTVCNSEVWDLGDGMFDVHTYNAHDELVRATSYDSDGSISSEQVYEIEYDADGNRASEKYYESGVLQGETLYAPCEDGVYAVKYISYQEDGAKDINEYNESGDLISFVSYDADESKLCECLYEYAVSAHGASYEAKNYDYDYQSEVLYISEYNEYGDQISRAVCDLDGNEKSMDRFEYEYNENGDKMWLKQYTNDVLVHEILAYKVVFTEEYIMRFPETVIDYNEDGTKLVTVNGDNGEIAHEACYNADGTVEYELFYTYETDDEGNWKSIKVNDGERLITDTEYSLDADGMSYVAKVTEYNEDGSKTVCEYDENEELVKETRYNADGSVAE